MSRAPGKRDRLSLFRSLTAADNAVTFKAVVNSVAVRNGLAADFSPKPLMGQPGSRMHINISAKSRDGAER